jgi:hypothetical protein
MRFIITIDCTGGERRAAKRISAFLRLFLVHAISFSACRFSATSILSITASMASVPKERIAVSQSLVVPFFCQDNPVTNFRRFRDMLRQPQH